MMRQKRAIDQECDPEGITRVISFDKVVVDDPLDTTETEAECDLPKISEHNEVERDSLQEEVRITVLWSCIT